MSEATGCFRAQALRPLADEVVKGLGCKRLEP